MRKVFPFLNAPWQSVRVLNTTGTRLISNTPKLLSEKDESKSDPNNPINRTFSIIKNDLKFLKNFVPKRFRESASEEVTKKGYSRSTDIELPPSEGFQTHCDVLVIGGGAVGSSIAYWLKKKARDGLNVVIVEKDTTYRSASTVQNFHGLNQNFSLPENIQMASYGADFLRGVKDHLGDVDINFTPYGSLLLASEQDAAILKANAKLQNELGVHNELLSTEKLNSRFPWLNTEGIVLGCHGLERQGWFNPLPLLFGFKNKARDYGAHFVEGEIVDFEFRLQSDVMVDGDQLHSYQGLDKAVVRLPDGETRTIKFALCVIAAGSSSGYIGRLARIGRAPGLLTVPLPVEPRKQYAYVIHSDNQSMPTFATPLTVDPNGTYFRREGLTGNYICGRNTSGLSIEDTSTEQHIFHTDILPTLSNRVNAFKSANVLASWADRYEYNTFDENGIIGTHPYYNNLYIAAGFNAHGMQMTPAIGRAVCELIIDGRYRSIDLERLGFDRLIVNQPLYGVSTAY